MNSGHNDRSIILDSDMFDNTDSTDSIDSTDSVIANIIRSNLQQMHRSLLITKKNAIFMMCIINDHYIIGACIAAYCHRKLLISAGIKDTTDIVIMCDDKIYDRYHKLLINPVLFDLVIKLDLRMFPDAGKYNYSKMKYSSWIGASLNKWKILDHDEYNRIMFVDIALLPVDQRLYDLFKISEPGVLMRENFLHKTKDTYNCADGQNIKNKRFDSSTDITYDQYLRDEAIYGTIHGNLVIVEPNKDLYRKYVEMTDVLYDKTGIYSIYKSGPDETSLFYFFLKMGIMVHTICHENAVIPWDEPGLIDVAKGYEFSAIYKPWTKPKVLCWPEELLWRDIYDIMIKHIVKSDPSSYSVLNELFKKTMVETYFRYINSDSKTQNKNYGNKFVLRYKKEMDDIKKITSADSYNPDNPDNVFDALMLLDSKIYVKYYGPLITQKITELL